MIAVQNNRWRGRRIFWILIVLCVALVIGAIVPVIVYFVTRWDRPSNDSSSPKPQSSSSAISTSSASSSSRNSSTTRSSTTSSSSLSSLGSTVPTEDLDGINQQLLQRHNVLRSLHGVANMTWNSELQEFAANYAANNFSCDNVQLIHSGGPYGENLAAGYVGGEDLVTAWYDEIDLYDYDNPGFSEETGHFTQLIWDDSVELGCAIVRCNNAWRQYTICEYYPMGNIVGSTTAQTQELFTEHVPRLLDPWFRLATGVGQSNFMITN